MDICCADLMERTGQKIQCHVDVGADAGHGCKEGDPQRRKMSLQMLLQPCVAAKASPHQNSQRPVTDMIPSHHSHH